MLAANPGRDENSNGASVLVIVEGSSFQNAITGLVLANLAQLALETDLPDWPWWPFFDIFFVLAFAFELLLRLAHGSAWREKERWWTVFDSVMVFLGLLEASLSLVWDARRHAVLRALKLSRLARAFRIFHVLPRYALFLKALISMARTFFWVFALLFLFCLISAIIFAHVLGEGGLSADDSVIKARFGGVSASLFTLFQLTTQDNWCDFALPVVDLLPYYRLFFVSFIVICSWTLISMLTAVASDSMLEATTDRKATEQRLQLERQDAFIKFLTNCFKEGDADGNGEMDREEFEALVQQSRVIREMQRLGAGFTADELNRAWAMLDFEDTGIITIDAFVEGLSYLMDTLSTRHILSVDGKVKRSGYKVSKALSKLSEELLVVQEQNKEILELCKEEELWQQEQDSFLDVWKKWVQVNDQRGLDLAKAAPRAKSAPSGSPVMFQIPWHGSSSFSRDS